MCGFAGILTTRPEHDVPKLLDGFCTALRHRGPDSHGTKVLDLPGGVRLGLAHTRLAILDLSPEGQQPMADPATGSWIAYNGEVYNHRELRALLPPRAWRSTSDTETLLAGAAAWGDGLAAKCNGMFAWALYDAPRRRLELVRDPRGIKPLYYARIPGGWLFASEVRALLDTGLVPRTVDPYGLAGYLRDGSTGTTDTMLKEVRSFAPGVRWTIPLEGGLGEPRVDDAAALNLDWPAQNQRMTRPEAVERLRELLPAACGRCMLADVPVGVFLSGGIDSSALVATLTHAGHRLKTFSVAFGEAAFDESRHAATVARHFGAEHTELKLSAEEVLRDLPEALAAYDQPSQDGVNSYFVSRATRRAGATVALSGLGGDELFAGYPYHRQAAFAASWKGRLSKLAGPLLRASGHPKARKLAELVAARDAYDRYFVSRRLFAPEAAAALLRGGGPAGLAGERELRAAAAARDAVGAFGMLDAAFYMANTLLKDGDQMSMAHALEVRFPLLDRELVGFAATIPGRLLLEPSVHGPSKGLLLDALPVPLPASVVRRRKQGFVFPWSAWLRGTLRPWGDAVLRDAPRWAALGMDPAAVAGTWDAFQAGKGRYSELMALLCLGEWARRHRVAA